MNGVRSILLLAAKDLRVEARTRHATVVMVLLAAVIVAVLAIGLGPSGAGAGARAGAVLWAAYLFGGVLVFDKTMESERCDDAMAALLMTPLDRGSIYLAKLIANLCLLLVMAAVVTPLGALFFGLDLSAAPVAFARTTALSMLGFAAVGTLFGAAACSTGFRGGILAVLVFPLVIPLVLISTHQMQASFGGRLAAQSGGEAVALGTDAVLVALDVLFLAAGWLLYEPLLEGAT